jgi:hypothetical protein
MRPAFFDRRFVRISIGLSIAGLLLGAGGAWFLMGGPHPVTVADALRRFHDDKGAAKAPAAAPLATASRPANAAGNPAASGSKAAASSSKGSPAAARAIEEGVYAYATTGHEETDALSGSRHDYPSETTITYRRTSCGWIEHWQPLDERWDESEVCTTPAGAALRRFSMYHEFFRRGVREDFACPSSAIVGPKHPSRGKTWSFHCASPGTQLEMRNEVIGIETVTVAGRPVRAVHIRYSGEVHGDDEGTLVQERWFDEETGLLYRMITVAHVATESPFGRVNYDEDFRIDLTSTKPQS